VKNKGERLDTDGLPSTEQLAQLAATLARSSQNSASELAKAALTLWKSAEKELKMECLRLAAERQWQAVRPPDSASQSKAPIVPTPKRFPVTHDEFLRLVLPKLRGRTGEQATVFKRYLRASEGRQDVNEIYKKCRERRMTEIEYESAAGQFIRWYTHHRKTSTTAARSKAASIAWAKRTKRKTGARPPKAAMKRILTDLNSTA
jgi:hypothetical protein